MAHPDPERPVRFLVMVDSAHKASDVAQALRHAGLAVDRILEVSGVVGGLGKRRLKQALVKVPGVELVREDGAVQLPPFSERVPQ